MAPKTKGFLKYSVILVIIALLLGGCKKDDKGDDTATPPDENSTSVAEPKEAPTPPPINNTEAMRKILAASAHKNVEISKIASSALGWNSALSSYNGKDAPNMKLKDINNKPVSISSLKGKKTVIVRWLTKHEPSKQMVQTLVELQNQVGAENLAVIAISSEDPGILKPVVEAMEIPFSVVGRGNRLTDPYRKNLDPPACFFIDKAGKIQLITQKVIPPDALNSIIEAL
jgi:peroxiredoxin